MTVNVLLVGLEYAGPPLPGVHFDVLGLCRPDVHPEHAAYALYEYEVIIVNPASYSHFIFGRRTAHSDSANELWDLKAEKNDYDLDNAFGHDERQEEMVAAIARGTRVVWLLAAEKFTKFYGARSVYTGYAHDRVEKLVQGGGLQRKKSKRIGKIEQGTGFEAYFERLQSEGWSFCLTSPDKKLDSCAISPEGYSLGGKIALGERNGWILTPPGTQSSTDLLIRCALGLGAAATPAGDYHGIFLSHTSVDKPFVRKLKQDLNARGVNEVWLDEAEILIGDSLTKKIDEGLKKTRYIGVVLSPRSIKSAWVGRELEIAVNREIATGEVAVLPLLYEPCELPSFLVGKMYADFTSPGAYEESLNKLLQRLRRG